MHLTRPAFPRPIIIDTDIYSDADDVGALAIANVLHNSGYASLKGVMVNTHSRYGCLAASVINTYYGNGDIPIGALRPFTNTTFGDASPRKLGEFARNLASFFPHDLQDEHEAGTPVDLYRRILAASEDSSVTIVSIGFLDNLAALLSSSPDSRSPLRGVELVKRKVCELVVMGGRYPVGEKSWNFSGQSPHSARFAINNWPGRITFTGTQPGASILSGGHLASSVPSDSPLLAAYRLYLGEGSTAHKSWDPIAILYSVFGLDDFAAIGAPNLFAYANKSGYNKLIESGANEWVHDKSVTNQHWLKLSDGVTEGDVARLLDRIMAVRRNYCKSLNFRQVFVDLDTRRNVRCEL